MCGGGGSFLDLLSYELDRLSIKLPHLCTVSILRLDMCVEFFSDCF